MKKVNELAEYLYKLEKALYEYQKINNREMSSFLEEEEKRFLANISKEKAFLLMNYLAKKHHLENTTTPDEVMLINGTSQDLPLKRSMFLLEKKLCEEGEFRKFFLILPSPALSIYFMENNSFPPCEYAEKFYYYLQLDAMDRFIGKLEEHHLLEQNKDLLLDLLYLYPDLKEDIPRLKTEEAGRFLGCRFSLEQEDEIDKDEIYEYIAFQPILAETLELALMDAKDLETKKGKEKRQLGEFYIESYLHPLTDTGLLTTKEGVLEELSYITPCSTKNNAFLTAIFDREKQKRLSMHNVHKSL